MHSATANPDEKADRGFQTCGVHPFDQALELLLGRVCVCVCVCVFVSGRSKKSWKLFCHVSAVPNVVLFQKNN